MESSNVVDLYTCGCHAQAWLRHPHRSSYMGASLMKGRNIVNLTDRDEFANCEMSRVRKPKDSSSSSAPAFVKEQRRALDCTPETPFCHLSSCLVFQGGLEMKSYSSPIKLAKSKSSTQRQGNSQVPWPRATLVLSTGAQMRWCYGPFWPQLYSFQWCYSHFYTNFRRL